MLYLLGFLEIRIRYEVLDARTNELTFAERIYKLVKIMRYT